MRGSERHCSGGSSPDSGSGGYMRCSGHGTTGPARDLNEDARWAAGGILVLLLCTIVVYSQQHSELSDGAEHMP